jgi:hypothetical protein
MLFSTALLAFLGVFSSFGAGVSRFTGPAMAAGPFPVAVAAAKICLLFVAAGALCWLSECLPGVRANNASLTATPVTRAFVRPKDSVQHVAPLTGPLGWDDATTAAADTLKRSGSFRCTRSIWAGNLRSATPKAGVANAHRENLATEDITDDIFYGEPTPEKYCAFIVAGLGSKIERKTSLF